MASVDTTNFDNLEIKTRSIEQTLLPLIKQVITVNNLQYFYFIFAHILIIISPTLKTMGVELT